MPVVYQSIVRVSTTSSGLGGDHGSGDPVVSPDGTKVVFASDADDLVVGDTNGVTDLFLKDLATGAITRISTDTAGAQANDASAGPVYFSADSSKIIFTSAATNLVAGDTNNRPDVFVKTLSTGVTIRVSTDGAGVQANSGTISVSASISGDGNLVAFDDNATNLVGVDTNGAKDVFVKNLTSGAVVLASTDSGGTQGNGTSLQPFLSPDGTKVAFLSSSTNLVAGDTNGFIDVFVKILSGAGAGTTTRISTDSAGAQSNGNSVDTRISFSADGTKVVFSSAASNLVAGDTNGVTDVFVKDMVSGVTTLVSTSSAGALGNGSSSLASFSPDGTRVMFTSSASNLVTGDTNGSTDVFVKNLTTGELVRVTTNQEGVEGSGNSAATGAWLNNNKLAFHSSSTNLVINDTGGHQDAFVITFVLPDTVPTGGASGGGGGGSTGPTAPPVPVAADIEKTFGNVVGISFTAAKATAPTVVTPDGKTVANPIFLAEQETLKIKAQLQSGAINFTQAVDKLIALAGPTSVAAFDTYKFFAGAPPTSAGMQYLLDSTGNATDLTDGYYAGFNQQQRFMNLRVSLAKNGPAVALFAQNYGGLSFEAAVRQAYDAVIGKGYAIVAGIDVEKAISYLVGQQAYFTALGGGDIGGKAAMIGFLMSTGFDQHVGLYYETARTYLQGKATLSEVAPDDDTLVSVVGAHTDAQAADLSGLLS